jgi:hypothetical protein
MKGIIFTSFIEFTERELGETLVDQMLTECPTGTDGAFTNVGTYPVEELLTMVEFVLPRHHLEPDALQRAFGAFTFDRLVQRYPEVVDSYENAFECIFEVDQTIHRNVRKLYPDAELPNMNARFSEDRRKLSLEYRSARPFMHVAQGLIEGCLAHFGEDATIHMTDHSEGAGTHAFFVLERDD